VAGQEATSAFAGEPQPVEVYHRGIWYLGELLGWRHENDGRCLARVRCIVDGLRHSAWKDLADLRLPEPIAAGLEPADEPESDATRPHVFLADLRTRPRPPAHAVVPPPRWEPATPAADMAAQPAPAGEEQDSPVPATARRAESGDWTHLRRGGRLTRI
jgi:hypothetical protein